MKQRASTTAIATGTIPGRSVLIADARRPVSLLAATLFHEAVVSAASGMATGISEHLDCTSAHTTQTASPIVGPLMCRQVVLFVVVFRVT